MRSKPRPLPALRIVLAFVLVLAIPFGQAAGGRWLRSAVGDAPALGATSGSDPTFIAARDARLGTLPDDPRSAARRLVDVILGPDPDAAQVATMELLRQAGIPVISIDGAVVALPDRYLLRNAPMIGELLPNVTVSVRGNDAYTITDLGSIMVDDGLMSVEPDADLLMAGIAGWGKADDAPRESVFAGTAFRELGARRGNVYHAGVDPAIARIDLLQLTLIVAHLAGEVAELEVPAASARPASGALAALEAPAVHAEADECRQMYDALQLKLPTDGSREGVVSQTLFRDALFEWLGTVNEAGTKALKGSMRNVDIASKALNTIAFLAAVELDLKATPDATHFGHGGPGKDVTVTATARWQQNATLQELRCLQGLAGVDTRANGAMPGLRVRWSIDGPQTSVKGSSYGRGGAALLRAKQGQGQEFSPTGAGGALTGPDGTSSVVLEPRIERRPGEGKEMHGNVQVRASLDKDQVPDALKLFLGNRSFLYDAAKGAATNWAKFLFDQLYDISLKAIQKAGLPTRQVTVDVGYHGADVLVIQRQARHPFLLYYTGELEVEAYTCEGLNGRWLGTATLAGDKAFWGQMAEKVTKIGIPNRVRVDGKIDALVDLRSGQGDLPLIAPMSLGIHVDTDLIDKGAYGVVGSADAKVNGESMSVLMFFDALPQYLVERVRPDLMGPVLAAACAGTDATFP
jgi:hypothetical protein